MTLSAAVWEAIGATASGAGRLTYRVELTFAFVPSGKQEGSENSERMCHQKTVFVDLQPSIRPGRDLGNRPHTCLGPEVIVTICYAMWGTTNVFLMRIKRNKIDQRKCGNQKEDHSSYPAKPHVSRPISVLLRISFCRACGPDALQDTTAKDAVNLATTALELGTFRTTGSPSRTPEAPGFAGGEPAAADGRHQQSEPRTVRSMERTVGSSKPTPGRAGGFGGLKLTQRVVAPSVPRTRAQRRGARNRFPQGAAPPIPRPPCRGWSKVPPLGVARFRFRARAPSLRD